MKHDLFFFFLSKNKKMFAWQQIEHDEMENFLRISFHFQLCFRTVNI